MTVCLPPGNKLCEKTCKCSNKSSHQLLYLQVSVIQHHFLFSAVSKPTVAGNLSQWWSRSPSFSLSLVTLLLPEHMCDIGMRKFMMGPVKKDWPWQVDRPMILLQDRWRYERNETGGCRGNGACERLTSSSSSVEIVALIDIFSSQLLITQKPE